MSEEHRNRNSQHDSIQHELVHQSGAAWNGQPYQDYPSGKPQLSVMRMSLPPHTELPWHTHPMPNAAYVLSGMLTIEDKASGECHTVHAGEALNETVDSAHRGFTQDKGAELVIFYAGVEGQVLSVPLPGESPEF
ncbi:cupin domain-containing protein [Siccibacter turicensis]|uniref:cupin domain-containing protein n=1 Tax=Siccibacter turicensis TaxID=357233 RepID=UPI002A6AE37D|nr:cupin domain-containing protein [Siccibacter turicensis]MDY0971410.1 cupin domain-containing protein [Siccibacter turicensis]